MSRRTTKQRRAAKEERRERNAVQQACKAADALVWAPLRDVYGAARPAIVSPDNALLRWLRAVESRPE